jgi:preprotein translocase subunit SecA
MSKLLHRPGATVDLATVQAGVKLVHEQLDALADVPDDELAVRATALRERVEQSRGKDGKVDVEFRAEAIALGSEAASRALEQRPFENQLLAAMAMTAGATVAELATGEGKTLAGAIAAASLALAGGPVHVLTVNDYLAKRDAEWMAPVYRLLGVTVGYVDENTPTAQRRAAYACDITYASISEGGFDYLRDGLVIEPTDRVQRGLATAIVDEVDAIGIDEARVPLVLAGALPEQKSPAGAARAVVRQLTLGEHYEIGEDRRSVNLTTEGSIEVERIVGDIDLYATDQLELLTAIQSALHAEALLVRDIDYLVRGGAVHLIDEHRGRVAQRRRWPDGLQTAVEIKEGLVTSAEGQVLATLTVQALLSLYDTVSGMTATATRVGEELREFYTLEIAVIPPNNPCIRVDEPDRIFRTREEKETALLDEVALVHAEGQPVLVGTLDVAESERIAEALEERGITCAVLNARNDAEEAQLIAEAGGLGAVTVSTQMAGRGTDIRLGGSDQSGYDEVAELGGLLVIGCGRHESGRVDDQLRGRSGRQGDPGRSVFFVSLEDPMVAHHAADDVRSLLSEDPAADGSIPAALHTVGHAQRVAEGVSAEIHRNTLRYHTIVESQRRAVVERRAELQEHGVAAELFRKLDPERYAEVEENASEDALELAARLVALHHLDECWTEHLATLADIREGVYLRSLGRLDPLDEFNREAVGQFHSFKASFESRCLETFASSEFATPGWTPAAEGLARPTATWTYLVHDDPFGSELERAMATAIRGLFGRA